MTNKRKPMSWKHFIFKRWANKWDTMGTEGHGSATDGHSSMCLRNKKSIKEWRKQVKSCCCCVYSQFFFFLSFTLSSELSSSYPNPNHRQPALVCQEQRSSQQHYQFCLTQQPNIHASLTSLSCLCVLDQGIFGAIEAN